MGVIHQTTRPNEWVGVPYQGGGLDSVYLALVLDENIEPLWIPAFYENNRVLIRCPQLEPGNYLLRQKAHNVVVTVSRVKVVVN